MNKKVLTRQEVEAKINHAVDLIADPIRQTLSPKGGNVIIQNDQGNVSLTNDGVTIARSITVKDLFEDAIIDIIKSASLRTNSEAGDGTSSTILLSQVLIKESLKMLDRYNPMDLKKEFESFREKYIAEISKTSRPVTDKDMLKIASISANNDLDIAKNVEKVMKVVGTNGNVIIKDHPAKETLIEEDLGFRINTGVSHRELFNHNFQASYKEVPVLITDKRLYYENEAITILSQVKESGYNSVVIVARDFIGKALDTFIANHTKGYVNVLLIKDPKCTENDNTSLDDLAIYLGGKVISERSGSIVNKITHEDFTMAKSVLADANKTLLASTLKKNKKLDERVKSLKAELNKDKDNDELKSRVASLTSGLVTIKVGGSTPIEVREKMYRYEDSVNAVRAAMENGYVIGGGTTQLKCFKESMTKPDLVPIFRKYSEAIIRQICLNSGKLPNDILDVVKNSKQNWGYNAITGTVGDLLVGGVIEPLKVVTQAILNSISVAGVIISSNYYIINDPEENNKRSKSDRED